MCGFTLGFIYSKMYIDSNMKTKTITLIHYKKLGKPKT